MRVLYLTHNVTWKGGGAFFRAFHQARYLVRRGHQLTVLSIAPQSRSEFHQFEAEGVRIRLQGADMSTEGGTLRISLPSRVAPAEAGGPTE